MTSLQDFKRTLSRSGTEYQVMRAEQLIPQIVAGDDIAYDILDGLAQEEGANAVTEVLELAAKVAPGGRIDATHVRAAIRERFSGTDKARQTILELGRMSWPDYSQRRG